MQFYHIIGMVISVAGFVGLISSYIIKLMILNQCDARYTKKDTCKLLHKQTDETNCEIKETLKELTKKIDDIKDLFISTFAKGK